MDFDKQAHRAITGNLTHEEEIEFQSWLDKHPDKQEAFTEMKTLWQDAGDLKPMTGLSFEARWQKLDKEINQTSSIRLKITIAGIAASVLLALLLHLFLIQEGSNEIKTILATRDAEEVHLPDQSIVTLAKGASLSYPLSFDDKRAVNFTGEGFFEVSESEIPFVLRTNLGVVQVLGTTFNVKETEEKIQVVCVSGSVEVGDDHSNATQVLQAGMRSIKWRNQLFSDPVVIKNSENIKSWIKGDNVYEDEELRSVLDDLENRYDVEIIRPASMDALLFNGLLPRNKLEESLEIISLSTSTSLVQISERSFQLVGD